MPREYFCAYHSYIEAMEQLSDAECGRLFRACLQYSKTGEAQELGGNERFIFPGLRSQMDRDKDAYQAKIQRQSQNGRLGGRPPGPVKAKKAAGFSQSQTSQDKEEDKDKGKGKGENPPRPPQGEPLGLCPPDIREEFAGYWEARKKSKAPMTERAVGLALQELEKLAPGDYQTQRQIINQSVMHGWKGLFPLKREGAALGRKEPPQGTANPFVRMYEEEHGP